MQQREDFAVVIWLRLDGDPLTEARHCVACQLHEPVIDVSCSGCGDGPLITGQPPELGDLLAPPAPDRLHCRGWQLHPAAAMPRRPEIAASIESPCAMTLRILHQPSSQAELPGQ